MQAIGMLETLGLIGAIEGADVMLKTANVALLDKTNVGGGLVTVTVSGDVAAVKSSVEAGAAAIRQLGDGLLRATHVIPRPDASLAQMMIPPAAVPAPQPDAAPTAVVVVEAAPVAAVIATAEEADATPEDPGELPVIEVLDKAGVDALVTQHGFAVLAELLTPYRVVELRNLAREYDGFGIAGREISKANKSVLLEMFAEYYQSDKA